MLRESNAIEGVYGSLALTQSSKAWDYAFRFDSITSEIIKHVHKLMMIGQPLDSVYRGRWRDVPVWIGGNKKTQTFSEIDYQVKEWCHETNKVSNHYDPIKLHVKFENIHPFIDGNGRVGRLLLNWHVSKKQGLPLIIFTEEDKEEYYKLFISKDKAMEIMVEELRKYKGMSGL